MDSVSQKQNYLSLTGIDQLQEATDNIEELQKEVKRLQEEVDNNVSPNFVTTDNVDQVINGNKAFINPVRVTGLIPFYNSATKTPSDIVFESKEITEKEYKLIYNPLMGVKVKGPLVLDDNTLPMTNIKDLAATLLDLKNQSVTTGLVFTLQANVKDQLTAGTIVTPFIRATTFISDTAKMEGGTVSADIVRVSNTTKNGQLFADIAQVNNSLTVTGNCDARMYLMGGASLINVTIPFVPSLQRSMTQSPTFTTAAPVSFFQGINSALAKSFPDFAISRYKHPFNYWITRISAMFDAPIPAPTANVTHTIAFKFYSADGATEDVGNVEYKIQFVVTPKMQCATTDFLLYIPFNKSLGATHVYSSLTGIKNVQYVIHGFQTM